MKLFLNLSFSLEAFSLERKRLTQSSYAKPGYIITPIVKSDCLHYLKIDVYPSLNSHLGSGTGENWFFFESFN